jgi:hypothetical protein|tara:strand:+ start:3350 stop:3514 length:165 start_codon:yes stop_codon:yes gene_type:complete
MEQLYKVLEFTTTGWEVPNSEFRKLTKEDAKQKIDYLLSEGTSPSRIKAVPDND